MCCFFFLVIIRLTLPTPFLNYKQRLYFCIYRQWLLLAWGQANLGHWYCGGWEVMVMETVRHHDQPFHHDREKVIFTPNSSPIAVSCCCAFRESSDKTVCPYCVWIAQHDFLIVVIRVIHFWAIKEISISSSYHRNYPSLQWFQRAAQSAIRANSRQWDLNFLCIMF